ncbi:MAG: hypothetical protein ACRD5E_07360 [Nitrososphaeraceae archaeon]
MTHLILVVATNPVFLSLVPDVYASSSNDNPTKSTDEQFKEAVDCSSDGIVMDNVKRRRYMMKTS